MLLFNIPPMMQWTTDQVANIINVFSAVGTVGALILLIVQERRNTKNIKKNTDQINDLANIVTRLAEANELQREQNQVLKDQHNLQQKKMKDDAKPQFSINTIGIDMYGKMKITLKNVGKIALITDVSYNTEYDMEFENTHPPSIDSGKLLVMKGTSKTNRHVYQSEYAFTVIYTDIFHNKYFLYMSGVGEKVHTYGIYDGDHLPIIVPMGEKK